MSISSVLAPGRVVCNVEARSKKHSLDIVCELLAGSGPDLSHDDVFDCMIRREKLGCTGIGWGVAIPHGCAEGINDVFGAFVKLRNPVDYDTPDSAPVDLIFGMLVPTEDANSYSPELESIAEAFKQSDLRRRLRAAKSSHELFEILTESDAGSAQDA